MSVDEEGRLMEEAATHIKPIIQGALLQAMRLKEILMLKISDVEIGAETITILLENNKTDKLDVIPIRSMKLTKSPKTNSHFGQIGTQLEHGEKSIPAGGTNQSEPVHPQFMARLTFSWKRL